MGLAAAPALVWWAALAVACRWQPGMKITALLDALNSALAEPFALAWSQDSPRFLLVFTVIYAVAVIVAVSDQKNTRPARSMARRLGVTCFG